MWAGKQKQKGSHDQVRQAKLRMVWIHGFPGICIDLPFRLLFDFNSPQSARVSRLYAFCQWGALREIWLQRFRNRCPRAEEVLDKL
jgi:hypothetical protein